MRYFNMRGIAPEHPNGFDGMPQLAQLPPLSASDVYPDTSESENSIVPAAAGDLKCTGGYCAGGGTAGTTGMNDDVVCFTLEVTATSIRARDICRGGEFVFDRQTGVAPCPWQNNRPTCRIVSTADLPSDIHEVLVAYHHKFHGRERIPIAELRLTDLEKRAFSQATDLWEARPLP